MVVLAELEAQRQPAAQLVEASIRVQQLVELVAWQPMVMRTAVQAVRR
jgi:hypothetical protein